MATLEQLNLFGENYRAAKESGDAEKVAELTGKCFKFLDKDGNGSIDKEELYAAFK